MQDLVLGLKKSNSERSEKRSEMAKISHYAKLFRFLECRFEDGETYKVKNFFDCYKMTVKDMENNDKVVYGFIAENSDRTYLSLNDIAFPKKLYKREIKKVDGEETTTYTQIENKVYQGDLAILFDKFKSQYKDALLAFDLLYCAIAKHNDSKFTAEAFLYPTETFQRFKGEYTTGNFYLFNLKIGGTEIDRLNEIFADICKDYEESLKEAPAEAPAEA
jgi:hypothetical protein